MPTPFEAALAQLNPAQRQAVETIEGPVMVIAGPGTGKTQVLTIRVANILKETDTPAQAILALTFTESAAHNMRKRLSTFLGPEAYHVRIETFHAFCDDVIRTYPEYFPIRLNSQPLSDIEKFQIMENLLETLPLTALRTLNSPFHYLPAILKAISDLKREGISTEKYLELAKAEREVFTLEAPELKKTALTKRQKEVEKMEELGTIYGAYQSALAERRRYDYDDMIRLVAEAFRTQPDLLAIYQEKFLYILVDEYQDTNAAQNQVVDLLASYWGEQANICVVGDPNQSIYRFQGASLENTLGFLQRYPAATVIHLDQGYRSPQSFYDAAAEVISQNAQLDQVLGDVAFPAKKLQQLQKELQTPLHSQSSNPTRPITVAVLPTVQHEHLFVLQNIQQLLQQGVAAQEIAVLYRNNNDGAELKEMALKLGIPIATQGTQDALTTPLVQQILQFVTTIIQLRSTDETVSLPQVLMSPWWELDRLTLWKLIRAAGKTKMSLYDRIETGLPELVKLQETKDILPLDFASFEDVKDRLARWSQDELAQPFSTWLERLLAESGVIKWVSKQPDRLLLLQQLEALLRFARQLSQAQTNFHAEDFLHLLTVMKEHNLSLPIEVIGEHAAGVTFSTVHKAKGQEWEHVFLAHCIDGRWGNGRAGRAVPLPSGILQFSHPDEEDRLQDDRRLFYVAITRAKKELTVTAAATTQVGQTVKEVLPSIFVAEVPVALKTEIDPAKVVPSEEELAIFLTTTLQPAVAENWAEKERRWLTEIVAEMPLSVSALNLYLRSPADFLNQVILKIPQPTLPQLAFGTAVHAALEMMYRSWLETQSIPKEKEVLDRFEYVLVHELLPAAEFEKRLVYGQKILRQYIDSHSAMETQPVFIEKFFGYGVHSTMLDDIRLTGRIDRVDWIDQSSKTVRVIDYKTGRSKTVNEIDGKVSISEYSERELALPEEVRGPAKRQLLFYKLLLQLDRSFTGQVQSGVFEYVEPSSDGKYVTRELPLLDADVEELKKLIRQVSQEIRQLKFLNDS
jgi:DNA helicase II / ATP-dependent DNA helicase PcrA